MTLPKKKICKACGERKLLEEFYAHPHTKDRRFGKCILCFRAYRKTLYQAVRRRKPFQAAQIEEPFRAAQIVGPWGEVQ